MVESHHLTFNLSKPFVVDRLDNHPAKAVFDPSVHFVLVAVCFVFHNLPFMNDFVRVDGCWIRAWVHWDNKFHATIGEADVFVFINYHANVAMLSASILGFDAASGIGEFFDEQIQIFIHWLTINFLDLVFLRLCLTS
jgi:hypothetical protein